jgi:hypothetical protein
MGTSSRSGTVEPLIAQGYTPAVRSLQAFLYGAITRNRRHSRGRFWVWLLHDTTSPGGNMRFGPFLGIAILLFILWLGGFLMFHIAGGLIHLLLLFAVISLVIHLFTGSKATA